MSVTPDSLLRTYSRAALERMARHRRLDTRGLNKEALIETLTPLLFDTGAIRRALVTLSPLERQILDEVHLLGDDAPTGLIHRHLVREGAIEPPPARGAPSRAASFPFDDAVARLASLGLMFSAMPSTYGSTLDLTVPGMRVFIPTAVLEHLPPVRLRLETCDEPAEVLAASPSSLLRDVYTILSLADQSPVPLTARGLIAKRGLVRLDTALRLPENAAAVLSEDALDRLPLLRALLEDLDLLVQRTGTLVAAERVASFLSQSAGERCAALMSAYRQTTRWCELFHVNGLRIEPGGGRRAAPASVIAARQRVLAEIADLPPECWIAVDHVVGRLKRTAYELLFPRQWPIGAHVSGLHYYYSGLYAGDNPLGWVFSPHVEEERGWDLVEGGLIRVVMIQALHWLGVLDLGIDGARAVAIRVTADGARLLRGEPLTAVDSVPKVVVQPNFQIFAFEPTDESVLFTLDRLADRVRAEQVVEYRLSRESVYRAQRSGIGAAAIVAFLERVSTVPLPQNIRRSLEEWGALHERVVVRRSVPLVHAANSATLDALYADAATGPLLGPRVAPTAALVSPNNLSVLRERMLAAGCLPALSEGVLRPARPALQVDAEGCITPLQVLPDIQVLRAVEQVAERVADGSLRVTPRRLQQAAARGLSAADVLMSLERFHAGPLPAGVVALVRRWARRWGRGQLAAVTLLEVESAEILADLLADRELSPHLQRLNGALSTAVVRASGVEQVRRELQARGMQLADQPN